MRPNVRALLTLYGTLNDCMNLTKNIQPQKGDLILILIINKSYISL